MLTTPPYRIETARTVIRCWEPADAPKLKEAIDASLEHLQEWMVWAMNEPSPVFEVIGRLRRFRAHFDMDIDYVMGIFSPDESRVLGGTGLHKRHDGAAMEIGYWVRANAINQGFVTETTAALTHVAITQCGADRVEIRCDPKNARSAAVPRKLGFTHEGTLRRRTVDPDGNLRDSMIWSLFANEFPDSPTAHVEYRAFDVVGEEIT